VIERDFTLILGWSSKVYSIIGELLIANENQKDPCIVILAERDKIEMEDDIARSFPGSSRTRAVICRSGTPLDLDDLAVGRILARGALDHRAGARPKDPDSTLSRTCSPITNNPRARRDPYPHRPRSRPRNPRARRLVGGKEAFYVQGETHRARPTGAKAAGSRAVRWCTRADGFEAPEIYFKAEPSLAGRTYRGRSAAYEDSDVWGSCAARLAKVLDQTRRGTRRSQRRPGHRDHRRRRHAGAVGRRGGGLPDVSALSQRERCRPRPSAS
jgi:hypothetical protein